ncbi:RNA polymerase sigma factor [Pelomonas sp. KK5]|uniref:RNA polymerase sigma factor n=1 Tax=Pelomonas sp. KK5 TaxID=1855730 RepID=UPI00097BFD2A|nr:RNA polymerase sigma factor [Pelomonas sp. KK5]
MIRDDDPSSSAASSAAARAEALDRAELAASARGDRAAFERLYRRHFPRLARFLRRYTARADLTEDVINKALWVVWSKAGEFRGDSKASTWITGIAYRCMLKALRDGGAHTEAAELEAEIPVDDGPDTELRDWVDKGLRLLPEDLRTTLELAYGAGLSCAEIGVLMGCAEGTVKARMFNARLRLRNLMPALGGLEPARREEGR